MLTTTEDTLERMFVKPTEGVDSICQREVEQLNFRKTDARRSIKPCVKQAFRLSGLETQSSRPALKSHSKVDRLLRDEDVQQHALFNVANDKTSVAATGLKISENQEAV